MIEYELSKVPDGYRVTHGAWVHEHLFLEPSNPATRRGKGRLRWRSTQWDGHPVVEAGSADVIEALQGPDLATGDWMGAEQVGASHGYESDPLEFSVAESSHAIEFQWTTLQYVGGYSHPLTHQRWVKRFDSTGYNVTVISTSLVDHLVYFAYSGVTPIIGPCGGGIFDQCKSSERWHSAPEPDLTLLTGLGTTPTCTDSPNVYDSSWDFVGGRVVGVSNWEFRSSTHPARICVQIDTPQKLQLVRRNTAQQGFVSKSYGIRTHTSDDRVALRGEVTQYSHRIQFM